MDNSSGTQIILLILTTLSTLLIMGMGYLIRKLEFVYKNTNSHLDRVNAKVDNLTILLEREKEFNTQLRIARLESISGERRKIENMDSVK